MIYLENWVTHSYPCFFCETWFILGIPTFQSSAEKGLSWGSSGVKTSYLQRHVKVKVLFSQSCLTLCDPTDCNIYSPSGSSVLEWVAISFSSETLRYILVRNLLSQWLWALPGSQLASIHDIFTKALLIHQTNINYVAPPKYPGVHFQVQEPFGIWLMSRLGLSSLQNYAGQSLKSQQKQTNKKPAVNIRLSCWSFNSQWRLCSLDIVLFWLNFCSMSSLYLSDILECHSIIIPKVFWREN